MFTLPQVDLDPQKGDEKLFDSYHNISEQTRSLTVFMIDSEDRSVEITGHLPEDPTFQELEEFFEQMADKARDYGAQS